VGPIHANVDTEWLHVPAGTAREGDDPVVLDRARTGFVYSGLHVIELAPGDVHDLGSDEFEYAVVPISGGDIALRATDIGGQVVLAGRTSVFEGIPDIAAIGRETAFELEAVREPTIVALAYAHARTSVTSGVIRAADIPVEVRGAGAATRQLNNLFAPGVGPFDRLTVVEGLVPGGNWASWPPHKHDSRIEHPDEAVLEEIYWFQVRGEGGWGAHRTYDLDEGWDVTATIRDGDAFLVPRGYHGPEMAAPGHDMYFLNVLAGPGAQRSLAFTDDPAHAHVREEWKTMTPDPRVPLTTAKART
jgi:5-deoxy-glucuronate isomerase